MLTRAEQRTLAFIKQFIDDHQRSPTVEEVAHGIEIKSKGVAHRYIQALVDAGMLQRIPNRHCNLTLVDKPESQPTLSLPLVGTIAAGRPIEAIAHTETVDLGAVVGRDANRYALKVKGDSMVEEGIFDGDLVICEHANTARDGEIVVALIDNQEATLKRLQRNPDRTITLIPANALFSPMVYDAERIQIQGRFIGLLRLNGSARASL